MQKNVSILYGTMYCFLSYWVKYRMSTGFYCIDDIKNLQAVVRWNGDYCTVDHFMLQGVPGRAVGYHQPYLISSLMICTRCEV